MVDTMKALRLFWVALVSGWMRLKQDFVQVGQPPMTVAQRLWLIAKEVAAVAFATRVPSLVVSMVFVLLAFAEPAQDMLSEAVLDVIGSHSSPVTLPWHGFYRLVAIVSSLITLAASAWYWSRVTLMYHRALPDLSNNDEGVFRSVWRPRLVVWWPRAIGTAVFVGGALGLWGAQQQYAVLKAVGPSWQLAGASIIAILLSFAFLTLLTMRHRLIPVIAVDARWQLGGAYDRRAPYRQVSDIFGGHERDRGWAGWRHVGNFFLALSLLATAGFLLWAGLSPVTLGDALGGLAVAQFAAAVAIPWFTLLTIFTATRRLPYFGLAALIVLVMPSINSCIFNRIDNHDVRVLQDGALAARATIDDVFDAWLLDRRVKSTIVYSSTCARSKPDASEPGECRTPGELAKCIASAGCELWKGKPPFLLVAAEGGASRAGYWTALSVGEMLRQDPTLRDSIFAISAVSGGSLGATLARALIDVDRIQEQQGVPEGKRVICDSGEPEPQPYLSCVRVFMRRDFLASAFAGMFYTDLLQRLIPSGLITFPDRAEALERSWEESWHDVMATLRGDVANAATPSTAGVAMKKKLDGLFGKGFAATWAKPIKMVNGRSTADENDPIKPWPILLLNGTNVETGRRVITSNVDALTPLDKKSPVGSVSLPCVATLNTYGKEDKRNGLVRRCSVWEAPAIEDPFTTLKRDIRISTAVNMSARFPLVEPAGGVVDRDTGKRAYHVVDGGIYENFGAQTVADVARYFAIVRPQSESDIDARDQWPHQALIRPMILLISSDHELDGVRQVAAAYNGNDDRMPNGDRSHPVERKMTIGCDLALGADSKVPVCNARLMHSANEVLGDPVALYRTRSGRGESGILSMRETLANATFFDENFFHFRHCMNGQERPASMTWYVSTVSRRFMNDLMPSTSAEYEVKNPRALNVDFSKWMTAVKNDPCQNHAELKRLLNRAERIRNALR